MKIIIVRSNTKAGIRYKAYYSGLLSRLGIYCSLNYIMWTNTSTIDGCIEAAKQTEEERSPGPKANKAVACQVEI